MFSKTISATEAVRRFGDLLAQVRYRRDSFLIKRGRSVVACLGPPERLGIDGLTAAHHWERSAHLSKEEASTFERDLRLIRRNVAKSPLRNPWER